MNPLTYVTSLKNDPLRKKKDDPTEPDVVMLGLAMLELRLDLDVVLRIVRLQLWEVLHVPLQWIHDRPDQLHHQLLWQMLLKN